jgi:hypothetical protein
VAGSLPVLFFGDPFRATVASVSLNPSPREYLNARGDELTGAERRFETLRSLGAADRPSLTPAQCDRAIETMRGYFDPGKPMYSFFAGLSRVLEGMGYRYSERGAAHLDLVQEATSLTWSALNQERPEEARLLVERDVPFLRWQIEAFPLSVLVCDGRTTLDQVVALHDAPVVETGSLKRLTWSIAQSDLGARRIAVVGWNIPLARPTGLTSAGQVEMGALLAERLRALGLE